MKSIALVLLAGLTTSLSPVAAAVALLQQDPASDDGFAPDGKRGFGIDLGQKRLTELLRSKAEADRAFFDELTQLSTSTRVQLLNVRQLYVERGFFKFLPGSAGDDLAALHIVYNQALDDPARDLAAGDARAKAFAAMLVDVKFNVRRDLMLRAEVAVIDLEHARAVFVGTQTGFVSLTPGEIQHIAARADLAAAELRALRSDLESLTPTAAEKHGSDEDAALAKSLLELARDPDEGKRSSGLEAALKPNRALESRMRELLFSSRIDSKLAPLREWRGRALQAGAKARAGVLELIPDTKEGEKPSAAIARMKKTDRMEQAYGLAVQGLANDPLDPELAWAAGHARQLQWPGLDSIVYFDRFLALVGIRTTDARPGNGRKLTAREQEAFNAITAFKR